MTSQHHHDYDVHPTRAHFACCLTCGFAVPSLWIKSRTSLDAFTARRHATARLLETLGIDREGNPVKPLTADQRDGGARFEAQQNADLDY